MKKVVGESLESLAGYSLVETPVPEPGPGQVRLRITDCGLGLSLIPIRRSRTYYAV